MLSSYRQMIFGLWVVPQGSVIEDSEKEVTKVRLCLAVKYCNLACRYNIPGFDKTEYFVVLTIQTTCLAIPFSATQN